MCSMLLARHGMGGKTKYYWYKEYTNVDIIEFQDSNKGSVISSNPIKIRYEDFSNHHVAIGVHFNGSEQNHKDWKKEGYPDIHIRIKLNITLDNDLIGIGNFRMRDGVSGIVHSSTEGFPVIIGSLGQKEHSEILVWNGTQYDSDPRVNLVFQTTGNPDIEYEMEILELEMWSFL